MSPEGIAHGIELYLESLRQQAWVAQAFYFDLPEKGMEGLLALPERLQREIDQLIWEAAGGQAVDPTESGELIAAAIYHSLEKEMGIAG